MARHRTSRVLRARRCIAPVAVTVLALALLSAPLPSSVADAHRTTAGNPITMYPGKPLPASRTQSDPRAVELGVRFHVRKAGSIVGLRFYKNRLNIGRHVGTLWTTRGKVLARAVFKHESTSGWQQVKFARPVALRAGVTYVASYHAPSGRYSAKKWAFPNKTSAKQLIRATAGTYAYGSRITFPKSTWRRSAYYVDVLFKPTSSAPKPSSSSSPPAGGPTTTRPTPPPTSTPPSSTGFPGPSNTGVPPGVALSKYTGKCTITTTNAVIDGKDASACGDLIIAASGVKITNSLLPRLLSDTAGGSVTVTDSEIDGGRGQVAAVSFSNVTLNRVDVHGGQHSVQCADDCVIENSWLHGQYLPAGADWHENAYISNGGSNVVLRHNTLSCDVKVNSADGGCSGNASLFGDFEGNTNFVIDSNLFVAHNDDVAYCLFAGHDPGKPFGKNPAKIVVTNNVFERGPKGKCGVWGAVTSWLDGPGNVWSDNRWDDGTAVVP